MTDLRTQCIQKLRAFAGNISGADKIAACKGVGISRPTLDKYLDGDVANVDTAISIIEFFNGRISQKMDRLQGAA